MQDIVKRLNDAKKQKGYTLKELSQASGLTLGTINKIMCGQLQKIKPDKLDKLAKALDVSVEYLTAQTEIACKTDNGSVDTGIVKIACISPQVKVADCTFNADQIIRELKKA